MSTREQYDAVIVGAGQAGGPLATALAGAGWKTALIERKHVGGTCVNEGCTPTKTMVASARVAYLARRAADYGVSTGEVTVDMGVVRQRKRDIVASFRSGSESRLQGVDNLDWLTGEASLSGPKSLVVAMQDGTRRELSADKIFINVGARPASLPIPGLESVPALDSTSIMELDSVPEHLIVLGGGYIGLEFGQMFRRFGSQVSIVQRGPQLAPREDADVAEVLTDILREDGIDVLLNANTQRVEQQANGGIRVLVQTPEGERTLAGSHLLVAGGRTPNSDSLNVDAAGLQTDKRGHILVNDRLETNVPGIYALGDVKGGPAFTHISYDDFRVIQTNLLQGGNASIAHRMLPYTLFTDPQLGRIGLSEKEAREQGYTIRVASIPMSYVARALEMDEPRGIMKAVVNANTDQILGAAMLGLEGGEVIGILQVAMIGQVPYTTLRDGIFPHPTLSEALNTLFMSFREA